MRTFPFLLLSIVAADPVERQGQLALVRNEESSGDCETTIDDSNAFCDDGNFMIVLPLCALEEQGIDPSDLFMNFEDCKGRFSGGNFVFDARREECFFEPSKNETGWFVFNAKIMNAVHQTSIINRDPGIELNFSCAIETHVSVGAEINVDIKFIFKDFKQDIGNFNVTMDVYNSSDFGVPIDRDHVFHAHDKVYIAYTNENSLFPVVVKSCTASPQLPLIIGILPPPLIPEYVIIEDFIPKDPTTKILSNGTEPQARIEFEAFQFKRFTEYPISIECEIEICELGNCDPLIPTNFPFLDDFSLPSDTNITVINSNLAASYIINGVGGPPSFLNITAPNNDPEYTRYAQSAVVAGQLYLFGGLSDEEDPLDPRKIVKFDVDSCKLILLAAMLTDDFTIGHAALATSDGSKALICFPPSPGYNFCDVFDGTTSVPGFNSTYGHLYAGLGLYNGQPTTVGSSNEDGYRKVETLGPNGWTDLPDSPMNYYAPSLVGVANGDLYVLGGRNIDENNFFQKSIYKLSKSTWTLMGSLTEAVGYGSAINVGSSIYVFAGENEVPTYPIQRVDISDDNITSTLIGSNQDEKYVFPILSTLDSNNCVIN